MLKIQVLGRGLIPRGYGLAPRKNPFPADFTLIETILHTNGLQVNMVHPDDGHLVAVTTHNLRRLWNSYSDKYNKPVSGTSTPTEKPVSKVTAPVQQQAPQKTEPVVQAPKQETKVETTPVTPKVETPKAETDTAKVNTKLDTKVDGKVDDKVEKAETGVSEKKPDEKKTFKPMTNPNNN